MRAAASLLLILAALAVPARAEDPPAPARLPPPPPPPAADVIQDAGVPQVTVIRKGTEVVEEFRARGKLYMIKVTPEGGTPYYLVDERGQGQMVRKEGPEGSLKVPQWVIGTF